MSDNRTSLDLNWNAGIKLNTYDTWEYEWFFENEAYPWLGIGDTGSAPYFEQAVTDMCAAMQECTYNLEHKKTEQVRGLLKPGYDLAFTEHETQPDVYSMTLTDANGEVVVTEGYAPLLKHLNALAFWVQVHNTSKDNT